MFLSYKKTLTKLQTNNKPTNITEYNKVNYNDHTKRFQHNVVGVKSPYKKHLINSKPR